MKQTMNFMNLMNLVFKKYIQTSLLVLGLILINVGILLLVNISYFVLSTGITLVLVGLVVNYEKNGGEKV